MKEIWKELPELSWIQDMMPETEPTKILISNTGNIKRLSYRYFNIKNNSYSTSKEYIYIKNTNRGKQRHDSKEKIKKTGLYQFINIRNKSYPIHRLVG